VSKLLVNPNVLLSPVADGYVAFDTVDQRLYQLNPVAALLVELGDGSRTRNELAAIVAPPRVPDACIRQLYERFSNFYESNMCEELRYEHHFQHIRDVAETFRMQVASHREAFLRMEYGSEVLGHYVCLA
jgi:hypothetical protein